MSFILNSIESYRDDFLEGLVLAYPRMVERIPDAYGVRRPRIGKTNDAVAVLIGGGSGHYPAFAGLVGPGLATGAVVGEVFTSPSAEQIYRCAKGIEDGSGVVLSYGNYSGDVMNFDMAAARLLREGIRVETVVVTDDIASAPIERKESRRGIAGDLFVFKVLGAASAARATLDDVVLLGRRANDRISSIGIAFDGCTLPGSDDRLFRVAPDKMELGLGIHGEPGIRSVDRVNAAEMASMLVEPLLKETPSEAKEAVILINGLGSTTYEELFILNASIARILTRSGVRVHDCEVGELVTSLNMSGCSLTIFWLDDELKPLYDAEAIGAGYRKFGR